MNVRDVVKMPESERAQSYILVAFSDSADK